MTKKEFIAKHGDFQLNTTSTEMLMECCHTPEKEHPYGSIFFLTGKMYNHGFYNESIDLEKLETNWDILSKNIELTNTIESMLNDCYFISDTDTPYKSFIMTDFNSEQEFF